MPESDQQLFSNLQPIHVCLWTYTGALHHAYFEVLNSTPLPPLSSTF